MGLWIRRAVDEDSSKVVSLIRELAEALEEESQVDERYVQEYLSFPGCGILLAGEGSDVLGLVSYSIRPSIFHAGMSGVIEELVVTSKARGRGIGTDLVKAVLALLEKSGCCEASVSTMPDNERAKHLYRRLGLTDEAVLLEKLFCGLR